MNLIFFIITMSFVCSNENDVYTFKTIYKVGDIDKYTNDQVLNFDIGGYENQQNQSFLSIRKYLGKEDEYILFEKNITDMVANTVMMGDVSVNHALTMLVDVPYVIYVDSSGVVSDVKTEQMEYEDQIRSLETDMSGMQNYFFPFGPSAQNVKIGDKWVETVDSLSFFPGDGDIQNFMGFDAEYSFDKIKRKRGKAIAYISTKTQLRCDMIYKQGGNIFEGEMRGIAKGKHRFNINSGKLLLSRENVKMDWSVTFEDKSYSSTMNMSIKIKKVK